MAVARLQRLSSVDACAITRLQSTSPPPQRPSRSSICVQMGHDMCHNLPNQVGEENKPPIARTVRAV